MGGCAPGPVPGVAVQPRVANHPGAYCQVDQRVERQVLHHDVRHGAPVLKRRLALLEQHVPATPC
eukprot:3115766-Pyramimonas_sp.AAC.1